MVAPRGHAPSTVSCLPHCLGDSNVGICHEVVRVVGGAENTSARNDNDDWIDTCRPQALGLVNKYRIVLSKWHELHSPGSASQISAVVLSYIAGISLAGRAKWRFGIGATILGAVRVIAEPNLERDMLCFTPGVLFGCAQRSTQLWGERTATQATLFARYGFIKAWRVAKIVSYSSVIEDPASVTNSYNGAHI